MTVIVLVHFRKEGDNTRAPIKSAGSPKLKAQDQRDADAKAFDEAAWSEYRAEKARLAARTEVRTRSKPHSGSGTRHLDARRARSLARAAAGR